MKQLTLMVIILTLTGCASITGSKLQPLSVQTVHDGKEVSGVGCTLTNDAGKWFVTSPGSVTVQKSTGDMAVDCAKDDLKGHENVVSKSNGAVWGNIIAGGGFDYPNSITVVLNRIAAAVGLVPSSATPAPELTSK
jgi:hypothetical protein